MKMDVVWLKFKWKFVAKASTNNNLALVQVMAWG